MLCRIERSALKDATKYIIFSPLLQNKVVICLVLVIETHREQVKDVLLLTPECMHHLSDSSDFRRHQALKPI